MPRRPRPRSVLIDTNLRLLWVTGTTDLSLLKTYKRVQAFTPPDYLVLIDFLASCSSLVTTPHILAETSNFLDQAPTYRRQRLLGSFREYVEKAEERHVRAKDLSLRRDFDTLGVTDAGIAALASSVTVLTTDFRLCGAIQEQAGFCVHFEQLRKANAP